MHKTTVLGRCQAHAAVPTEYRKRRPGVDSQIIPTKEILTCREAGSALFTMIYDEERSWTPRRLPWHRPI